jgi:DNA-binding beta-propeller fold protein YncE
MGLFRTLLVALMVVIASGWGRPLAVASGTAPGRAGAGPAAPTTSATIQVTVEGDQYDDPNLPASAGSGCSLREALALLWDQSGNRGCGPAPLTATDVTIKIPPGTYLLTINEDLPPVTFGQAITIQGPGSDCGQVTIDGGSQGGRHNGIFHVVDGELNLSNLTLRHGSRSGGGAIWEGSGAVRAYNVCFDSNDAAADPALNGDGGAIRVDSGALTVTQSIFKNNLAFDSGGAVATSFGYFLKDTFVGNRATAGGALAILSPTSSPVIVVQSQFKNNTARPQIPAQLPVPGYTTHGDSHGGGAIQNNGNLQLTQDLIQGNGTELMKGGGGFSNESVGNAQLLETVVTGNTASARGGGDTNQYIDYAWGGGIYNAGVLSLVRASVHGNRADNAAAIFNHLPGHLYLYNSTVSNNTAKYLWGGLVNENAEFDPAASQGAEIHLLHATIGRNNSSSTAPADNDLSALYPDSVWFGNSILDAGCNVPQYTVGRSVMTGDCITGPDINIDPFPGADLSNTTQTQLGLQPLSSGSSTVPDFQVQRIDGASIAAGIGRDDAYGCGNIYILHQDQNQAPRPAHQCDAGAIQAAAVASNFDSNPEPGALHFPVVDFTQGQGGSLATLVLFNTGGGSLTYQLVDEGGSNVIVNDSGSTGQGTLFKNQQATLNFSCHPATPGEYWREFRVETDAPNRPMADFALVCDAVGPMGQPGMDHMPGPYNVPMPPPGQTAHAGFGLTNLGHMPLAASPSLATSGPPWGLMLTAAAAAAAGHGHAPNGPAATLNPGQSLHVDVACTPTGPGVFLNTLVFTTSNPLQPVVQYNLACEGQVTSPPEALSPAITYTTGSTMEGVAVSPDGSEVLAGQYADNTLRVYTRNPATGLLTPSGYDAAWPRMSAIYGVQYSHDGKNVYYTSAAGNGIVVGERSGPGLNLTQVITAGTTYVCYIPPFLTVCPVGSMYGARGLAVSPDDQYVYVAGAADGTLTVFQRDRASGQLSYIQTLTHTIGGVNALGGASRVATSPDGNDVYVAATGDNAVSVFQRTGTGQLGLRAVYPNGSGGLTDLNTPTDVALSPDGNYVYVPAYGSNALNIFSRSSADGGLSLSSVVTGVTGVWGVAVTGDDAGRRLFLANYGNGNVRAYGRDPATGAVSLVGTTGESGPVFLAVSPDNQDVYTSLWDGFGVALLQTVHNTPVLRHISPASAVAGGSAFTLTAAGGRFYPDSRIVWAGAPLATVFVNDRELQAAVPAGLIGNQQINNVLVHNTAPGGGDSTPQPFAVTSPAQPPVPSIASLEPPAASFGGGDLVVLVRGANFAPSAQVYFNHVPVPTLFIDAATLQITLSGDILNTPGNGGLEVTNGGAAPALRSPAAPATSGSSTVVSFRVNPPGVPAAPALTSLAPASVVSGSAPVWLTLAGFNFLPRAQALSVGRWNGQVRPSVVIDAHTLLMELTQADLAVAGNGLVTVLTPGAGASAPVAFRVRLPNEKPIPVVTGATLKGRTLYVRGSDFDPAAQISLNGVPQPTTFVNRYEVTTKVTTTNSGVVVKVINPGPGGGASNAVVVAVHLLFLPAVRR